MLRRLGPAPWWLLALSGIFLTAVAVLLAASLARPEPPPTFPPGAGFRDTDPDGVVRGRYTVDARNPERWTYWSFARGEVSGDPEPEGWDLAVRRFRLVVNGGPGFPGRAAARALGAAPEGALPVPSAAALRDAEGTRGRLAEDPRTPALERWYRYGFFTHLLRPEPVLYGLRTAGGGRAALRILSYYCPGAEPGCVTFDYAWDPSSEPGNHGR